MQPYDVNAAIAKPNYLGMAQQGYAFGQQQRAVREEREDKNALRTLAPQIMSGDTAAFEQAAIINPDAAKAYQGVGDDKVRRLKGFIDYVEQARKSGNPQAVNAALAQGSNFIAQVTGKPGPTAWSDDPAFVQGWEGLKAKVAMLGGTTSASGVQSTYIDGDGNRVAIMRDGSTQVLGKNDAGMANQTISIPGPDGRERQYTFNKRTGAYEPAGGGMEAPSQQPARIGPDQIIAAISASAREMIAQGVPEQQVDAWAQQQMVANKPAGMTAENGPALGQPATPVQQPAANVQPAPMPAPANAVGGGPIDPLPGSGRNPFVSMSPGEKAASEAEARAQVEARYAPQTAANTERAKLEVQQDMAPRQAELDAQREASVVGARQGATNQAEREAVQRTNNTAFAQYKAARDTLLTDLAATSTGPLVGRLPAVTEAQQIAQGAQARMAPILKGLFRTAGEGTFTDKDQELLMAMVPTRTDLPNAVKAKIAGIDAIIEAKLQQGGQPEQADAPPVEGARKAPDGNWYVQRDGQYFKVEQ